MYSWHVHMFVLNLIVYVTLARVKGREIWICTLFVLLIIGVTGKGSPCWFWACIVSVLILQIFSRKNGSVSVWGILLIIGPFCPWTWNWKWLDVVMCPRLAVFFIFKVKKIEFNLRLMSTKQLTVPSSVFHGKESSILRKENNKTILTHKIAKGTAKNCHCYVPHALTENLFATALVPFFLLLCPLYDQKIYLSKITWASLFITSVSKFHLFTIHIKEI